jgi:hypothetical protein
MKELLGIVNAFILFVLAIVHFYWAFGGEKMLKYVIPSNPDSSASLKTPGFFATISVAFGLLTFCYFILSGSDNLSIDFSKSAHLIILRIIGAIFTLRAIGDFNYVGIRKRIKGTPFAKKDSQIYVPLCFWLGLSTIIISLLS